MRRTLTALAGLVLFGCADEPSGELDPATAQLRAKVTVIRDELSSEPTSAALYHRLGLVYQKYGVEDSARSALHRAVELQPGFAEAHRDLAELEYRAGELAASEAAWARTAQLAPGHQEVWNNLGFIRRKLGDLSGAEQAYVQALGIDSMFAQTLNNLGQVYREQERWDEAAQQFHKALVAEPTFRGAYVNLARLHKDRGDEWAERELLIEIRERFGLTSHEGRYASSRLAELGPGD